MSWDDGWYCVHGQLKTKCKDCVIDKLQRQNAALVSALESSLGFLREVHREVSGDRFTDRHDWTGISATLIKQSCEARASVRGAE